MRLYPNPVQLDFRLPSTPFAARLSLAELAPAVPPRRRAWILKYSLNLRFSRDWTNVWIFFNVILCPYTYVSTWSSFLENIEYLWNIFLNLRTVLSWILFVTLILLRAFRTNPFSRSSETPKVRILKYLLNLKIFSQFLFFVKRPRSSKTTSISSGIFFEFRNIFRFNKHSDIFRCRNFEFVRVEVTGRAEFAKLWTCIDRVLLMWYHGRLVSTRQVLYSSWILISWMTRNVFLIEIYIIF